MDQINHHDQLSRRIASLNNVPVYFLTTDGRLYDLDIKRGVHGRRMPSDVKLVCLRRRRLASIRFSL